MTSRGRAASALTTALIVIAVHLVAIISSWSAENGLIYNYDGTTITSVERVAAARDRPVDHVVLPQARPAGAVSGVYDDRANLARTFARPVSYRVAPQAIRPAGALDHLSRAAGALDRNGLTAAGRAAQKHGNRPGTSFPLSPDRTASGYNQFGQDLVDDLLTAPNTARRTYTHPSYGQVTEYLGPNYGARWGPNGEFLGFL